jgi:hypothetical protein
VNPSSCKRLWTFSGSAPQTYCRLSGCSCLNCLLNIYQPTIRQPHSLIANTATLNVYYKHIHIHIYTHIFVVFPTKAGSAKQASELAGAIVNASVLPVHSAGASALRDIGRAGSSQSSHAERNLHKQVVKLGFSLPVPLTCLNDVPYRNQGLQNHPVLSLRGMLQYMMDHNHENLFLGGLKFSQRAEYSALLTSFWADYKHAHSDHPIYSHHAGALHMCVPIALHGDEGRGLRKMPILCLQTQFVLSSRPHALHSRIPYTVCPSSLYTKPNSGPTVDALLNGWSAELIALFHIGVTSKDGVTLYFVVIGVKGDWPWHIKAYHFVRGFNCSEVCHLCEANLTDIPFEDMSDAALWLTTIPGSLPWTIPSPVIGIPGCSSPKSSRIDVFHVGPLGVYRDFVGSCVIALMVVFGHFAGAGSQAVPARLSTAYMLFKEFCKHARKTPNLKDWTRDNFHYANRSCFPSIGCKASDCLLCLQWLENYLQGPWLYHEEMSLMLDMARACNRFYKLIYTCDRCFLTRDEATSAMSDVTLFCRGYSKLALWAYRQGLQLFNLVPKLHMYAHIAVEMFVCLSLGHPKILNPALTACPMDEDMVGRMSRISRRTHANTVPQRTLQRYLIHARQHWRGT